jgi:outer membrane protein assembly factor BamB
MKVAGRLALGMFAAAVFGCGTSRVSSPGPQPVRDFVPSHERQVVEEAGTLPFKHWEWDFKMTNAKVRRVTLGSQHFWVETHDNWIIAVDRFNGFVTWKYFMWRDIPADWPPVEAAGVGEEITALRLGLLRAQRAVEIMAKQRPVVDEEEHFKKLAELKQKRSEFHEKIRAAHVNDNLYFVTRGWLYCLERTTGRELWYTKLDFTPSAQPFATRGHLFIPSSDFSRTYWLSVEQKGKPVFFTSNELDRFNQVFNRVIYDHPLAYHASRDGILRAWLVDKNREHWRFKSKLPWQADPYIHHLTRKENVYRVNENGEKSIVPIDRTYEMCFIGGRDRTFYALDSDGGNVRWQYALPAEVKSNADSFPNSEFVYVRTEDGYLHSFEVMPQHKDANGVSWADEARPQGPRWSIPQAERILMRSANWIYLMGNNHTVLRVNEQTGVITGKYPLRVFRHVFTNRMDDLFYVATDDGHFVALREFKASELFTPGDRGDIQRKREGSE